jgi:hypothetical protein
VNTFNEKNSIFSIQKFYSAQLNKKKPNKWLCFLRYNFVYKRPLQLFTLGDKNLGIPLSIGIFTTT